MRSYLDILKDTYLLIIILITIGGPKAIASFPTRLSSVLVYCLFGSIVLPIITSSLILDGQKIQEENDELEGTIRLRRKIIIMLRTLLTSVINQLGKIL